MAASREYYLRWREYVDDAQRRSVFAREVFRVGYLKFWPTRIGRIVGSWQTQHANEHSACRLPALVGSCNARCAKRICEIVRGFVGLYSLRHFPGGRIRH